MKYILLDVDDLVFCNEVIADCINTSSISYIARRFGIDYLTASDISNHLLPNVGHTTKIIDHSIDTLQDFNHEVFAKLTISELAKHVTEENRNTIKNLLQIKDTLDVEFVLCTNTPLMYCVRVFKAMQFSLFDLFSPKYIFTSDIIGCVKPDANYFNYVEEELSHVEKSDLIFIDKNILHVKSARKNFDNTIQITNQNMLHDCMVFECV